jgi:hypothetical protein
MMVYVLNNYVQICTLFVLGFLICNCLILFYLDYYACHGTNLKLMKVSLAEYSSTHTCF